MPKHYLIWISLYLLMVLTQYFGAQPLFMIINNAAYVNIHFNGANIELHNMYRNQEVSVRCIKD
jgi:hypothetical protein